MLAFVTGGTGFVGSNLVAALTNEGSVSVCCGDQPRRRRGWMACEPAVVIGPRDVNGSSGAMIVEAARGRLRVSAPGGTNFVVVADAFATVCDIVNRPGPAVVLPRWTIPAAVAAVGAARFVVGPRLPIDGKQRRLSSAGLYADGSKARTELIPEIRRQR
jgi:hypothetical protein